MRALIGFLVLLVGVGSLYATLAEPRRYQTDMIPLTGDDRLAGYGAAGQAEAVPAKQQVAQASLVPTSADAGSDAGWAGRTTVSLNDDTIPSADNSTSLDSATRSALARDIQGELARLGCYAGPLDGVWSPETQRAASLFATEANSRLPVSEPDFALFSLTKTATEKEACGPAIVASQKAPLAPAMGLGALDSAKPKTASYRNDRDVQSLFTNPLGR